jgi:hypothetical protein
VRRSLKVTVVRVGVAVQEPEVVVVEEEGEVVREGQAVFVAVLQGPVAEPRVQVEGRRAWICVSGDCD